MKKFINAPKECDICKGEIVDEFYDGPTFSGLWAFMCGCCFEDNGLNRSYSTRYVKSGGEYERV